MDISSLLKQIFRSLRFRLIAASLLILMLTGAIAWWFSASAIESSYENIMVGISAGNDQAYQDFAVMYGEMFEKSYEVSGGWDTAERSLTTISDVFQDRILLADTEGNIFADSANELNGMSLSQVPSGVSVPMESHDTVIGTLFLEQPDIDIVEFYRFRQQQYADSVRNALLKSFIVAGGFAFVLMLLFSHPFLKVIESLNRAAHRLAKGDLSERVDVHSQDEIGQLAASFNHMADELARTEKLRRNMVSDIAHELRTPLSNIQGYMEGLRDEVIQPELKLFDALHRESTALARLVEDLQELALSEAGQLRLYCQTLPVEDLVSKVVDASRALARRQRIELRINIPDDILPIYADPDRTGQILRNLLKNAITYTPAGGTVEVVAENRGNLVALKVCDTGPGIEPEHLPNLFERFYRADRSRARSTGGSGLGLAIVKQLTQLQGGEVSAESELGKGSIFTVALPTASA